jgi:hypothetical protein
LSEEFVGDREVETFFGMSNRKILANESNNIEEAKKKQVIKYPTGSSSTMAKAIAVTMRQKRATALRIIFELT